MGIGPNLCCRDVAGLVVEAGGEVVAERWQRLHRPTGTSRLGLGFGQTRPAGRADLVQRAIEL